jgi:hypothetical protein
MPTVVLKRGKIDDGTSFITYPNKSVADQALKQLISEKYVSGIKIIKPLFNEAGSTRKFLIKP